MKARDVVELLLLAALWGGSFLFMKLGAFEFGSTALAFVRVAVAAALLLPLVVHRGQWAALRQHGRSLALVGIVNSALPFVCFGLAVQSITAGTTSVLNATAPLWAALIAWAWLGEHPGRRRLLGIAIGFAGVVLLAGDKVGLRDAHQPLQAVLAIGACLLATGCYGFSANYTRRHLATLPPLATAAGTQAWAALALAVPALLTGPATAPSGKAWAAAFALGVLCTALAYLLYFRLIARLGAGRAITVTYVIPLFGVFWGVVFLGEGVTPMLLVAGATIVAGTALASSARRV